MRFMLLAPDAKIATYGSLHVSADLIFLSDHSTDRSKVPARSPSAALVMINNSG